MFFKRTYFFTPIQLKQLLINHIQTLKDYYILIEEKINYF